MIRHSYKFLSCYFCVLTAVASSSAAASASVATAVASCIPYQLDLAYFLYASFLNCLLLLRRVEGGCSDAHKLQIALFLLSFWQPT